MAIDSGNLHVMDAGVEEMQSVTQRIRHSKYPVVSIKNGVASALKDIKHSYTWLDKFDNIVLNFDNDDGQTKFSKMKRSLSILERVISDQPPLSFIRTYRNRFSRITPSNKSKSKKNFDTYQLEFNIATKEMHVKHQPEMVKMMDM